MRYLTGDKRRFLALVVIVVLVLLVSAWLLMRWRRAPEVSSYAVVPPDLSMTVVDGILSGNPCAPPCWQGVAPGTAIERDSVVALVEALPNVRNIWGNPAQVRWTWSRWVGDGTAYNDVYWVAGRVLHITLSIDGDLTVGDVLREYGPPEATNGGQGGLPEHPYTYFQLLYPTQGIEFETHLSVQDPTLEPTAMILNASYSVPAESLQDWIESLDFDKHLQPWPGYGELDSEAYGLDD